MTSQLYKHTFLECSPPKLHYTYYSFVFPRTAWNKMFGSRVSYMEEWSEINIVATSDRSVLEATNTSVTVTVSLGAVWA